jgi:hypothetical protein
VSCILDAHLWTRVEADAVRTTCAFCEDENTCTTFDALAEVVESVVNDRYTTVSESGAYHDDGELSETVHGINDVLDELLDGAVERDVLPALSAYIAGRDETDYGWVKDADIWATVYDFTAGDWKNLSHQLKQSGGPKGSPKTVDLPDKALKLLGEIREVAFRHNLFKSSTPKLWRCRDQIDGPFSLVARELGSPPTGHSNRMTTKDQAAFYGSATLRCAVREAAQSGDIPFAAGKFTPSHELYHFDAFAIPIPPSPFAIDALDDTQALEFLRRFAETLSEPNYDNDPNHYIPTQVFVRFLLESPDDCRPEAIRFRSSLDSTGENWVVFVDRDHCVDRPQPGSDLYLVLDADSRQCHPSSNAFL